MSIINHVQYVIPAQSKHSQSAELLSHEGVDVLNMNDGFVLVNGEITDTVKSALYEHYHIDDDITDFEIFRED